MSSDPSSFTLPSKTDVLPTSPLIDPAACTASLRSPPTEPSVRPRTMKFRTHLSPSILRVLSNTDALSSPPCSSVAVTTEPLACASPLTERALRSQRRDALRAIHDVAVVSSPTAVRSNNTLTESTLTASDLSARIFDSLITAPFTPQRLLYVYDYRTSATAPRVTTHVANHPTFTDRVPPTRDFSSLAPLRAPHSMSSSPTSTTASHKTSTGAPPKVTARMASSPSSAPGPLLDLSPRPPLTSGPPPDQGRAAPPVFAPQLRCRGPSLPSTTDPHPIWDT